MVSLDELRATAKRTVVCDACSPEKSTTRMLPRMPRDATSTPSESRARWPRIHRYVGETERGLIVVVVNEIGVAEYKTIDRDGHLGCVGGE